MVIGTQSLAHGHPTSRGEAAEPARSMSRVAGFVEDGVLLLVLVFALPLAMLIGGLAIVLPIRLAGWIVQWLVAQR